MAELDLDVIEARLGAVSGVSWDFVLGSSDEPVVRIVFDNNEELLMRVTRESSSANADDVRFIAHARADLEGLLGHLRGAEGVADDELLAIEARYTRASPGPWYAFLERDGGIGGCDVIRVSDLDNEPDLYLWVGEQLAPSDDFEFVANARQDIPRLSAAIRFG